MLDLGCESALNLDGGGSTAMWLKDRGVVNRPSDKAGERPVGNAIVVISK
jgi:exopolysaccharide biosynthesis protein